MQDYLLSRGDQSHYWMALKESKKARRPMRRLKVQLNYVTLNELHYVSRMTLCHISNITLCYVG